MDYDPNKAESYEHLMGMEHRAHEGSQSMSPNKDVQSYDGDGGMTYKPAMPSKMM